MYWSHSVFNYSHLLSYNLHRVQTVQKVLKLNHRQRLMLVTSGASQSLRPRKELTTGPASSSSPTWVPPPSTGPGSPRRTRPAGPSPAGSGTSPVLEPLPTLTPWLEELQQSVCQSSQWWHPSSSSSGGSKYQVWLALRLIVISDRREHLTITPYDMLDSVNYSITDCQPSALIRKCKQTWTNDLNRFRQWLIWPAFIHSEEQSRIIHQLNECNWFSYYLCEAWDTSDYLDLSLWHAPEF